jgi:hypothetical protein
MVAFRASTQEKWSFEISRFAPYLNARENGKKEHIGFD